MLAMQQSLDKARDDLLLPINNELRRITTLIDQTDKYYYKLIRNKLKKNRIKMRSVSLSKCSTIADSIVLTKGPTNLFATEINHISS